MSQISQFLTGGTSPLATLTGDVGGAVAGNGAGNITITGAGGTTVTGTPGTHSFVITQGVGAATTYTTDAGNATPAANILTVTGGTNIGTTGAGSTVTINLDPTITLTSVLATTFDTNVAAAGVTLAGTTLSADGTDANININITAKGTGQVIIDDLQLTTSLVVANGGTGTSTLTDHGVLIGSGIAAITAIAVGSTGEILIGNTGADCSWSASPSVTTMYATTFDTNVAAAGVTLAGTTLSADGTDPDININITPKGTGYVVIPTLHLTNALTVPYGGTGVQTLAIHGVLLGNAAGTINATAVGGTGTILTGVAGADPTWTTATYPTTTVVGNLLVSSATNVVTGLTTGTTGTVLTGVSGASPTWTTATYPATTVVGNLLVSSATNVVTGLTTGVTGTILTGVSGASPTWTTATYPSSVAKGDVLCASAANVVDVIQANTTGWVLTSNGAATAPTFQAPGIAPGGGIAWSREAGNTVAISVDHGYVPTNVGLTTFTLPAAAVLGTIIAVMGESAAGWKIAQRAGQNIQYGNTSTTVGVTGYLASSNAFDVVYIVCRVADTTWSVTSSVGVLNVA